MNAQHESPAPDAAREPALSPLDGLVLALLVIGMTAASASGVREAMYGCFAAAAGWLLARLAVRRGEAKAQAGPRPRRAATKREGSFPQRLRWALEATPVGYRLGMAGLAVAMAGLGGDIVWHTVFGVEDGIARVIAPFHLFLFTGAGLLITSPLRSTWASDDYEGQLTLRRALPPIFAMTVITALALFLFQWLNAFIDWKPAVDVTAYPSKVRNDPALVQSLQMVVIARIMFSNFTLVGIMLLGIRRFRLPFGAMTIVFTLSAVLAASLRNLSLVGSLGAALIAGLVADAFIKKLQPSDERTAPARIIAFVVSLTFSAAYLVLIGAIHHRTYPIDLAMGIVGLTGITGLALAAVAMPPAGPTARKETEEAPAAEPVAPSRPAPAPARVMEPVAAVGGYRPDATLLKYAGRVTSAAATREHPVEATVFAALLRGDNASAVAASFDPALGEAELARVCEQADAGHAAWAAQSLAQCDVLYLFFEAIRLTVSDDAPGERDLLAAWGVTRHGKRVLLGLRTGSRDRATAWGALGADLVERGMQPPALVVADGAPGVWRVIRELWPEAAAQHCVRHALGEASEGLPAADKRELRNRVEGTLDAARNAADGREQLEAVVAEFSDRAPAQMGILARRVERMTAHLAFPAEHRRAIRSATVLERALSPLPAEKGSAPGASSPVPLLWAVLDMAFRAARRMPMSLHAVAQADKPRRKSTATTPVHPAASSVSEA